MRFGQKAWCRHAWKASTALIAAIVVVSTAMVVETRAGDPPAQMTLKSFDGPTVPVNNAGDEYPRTCTASIRVCCRAESSSHRSTRMTPFRAAASRWI